MAPNHLENQTDKYTAATKDWKCSIAKTNTFSEVRVQNLSSFFVAGTLRSFYTHFQLFSFDIVIAVIRRKLTPANNAPIPPFDVVGQNISNLGCNPFVGRDIVFDC